jgi:LacI family transcriptional regulator
VVSKRGKQDHSSTSQRRRLTICDNVVNHRRNSTTVRGIETPPQEPLVQLPHAGGQPHGQPRRPTIHDVAAHAQVSFKTVSRVVNGELGVSTHLTIRVNAAIEQLGYRPDDRARRLRTSELRSNVIGFLLVDVANPFFSSILRGIEDVARKHDNLVLSASTDGDSARHDQLVAAFVARRVDGLVVVPDGDRLGPLTHEIARGTPLVFVDLESAATQSVDLVRSDHVGGSRLATEHLLRHGHTNIAYFGSPFDISSARMRYSGFEMAMQNAGHPINPSLVRTGSLLPDQWQHVVAEVLDSSPQPTALFTAQNFATLGALQELHRRRLRETVAHVSFDDVELSDVISPGLTAIPQHPLDIGRRATELLFQRINGSTNDPIFEILPSTIMERGSGEIRRV